MDIVKLRHDPGEADYAQECQEAQDLPLADLIDRAVTAAWDPREVYKAVSALALFQAVAYEEDR